MYETPDKKYELEMKFDANFPNSPPQFIFHSAIKNLLGDVKLNKLRIWTPESAVVDILHKLSHKIQEVLRHPTKTEQSVQISEENLEH